MCRRVTCDRCGQPTFAGCGRHVEEVLSDVPPAQRCRCVEPTSPRASSALSRTEAAEEPPGNTAARPRWWSFLER